MDDEENDEIAAAMGFASFGGTKKRKFDHSPKATPDANDASGANSTALGVRTKKVASAGDVEFDVDNLSSGSAQAQSSASARQNKNQTADSGLAGFLARGQNLPDERSSVIEGNFEPGPVASGHLPAADLTSFGGPSISRAELNALRHGVRMENGDTAYFLPSFVEDPWARLRKGASG
ncbi:hypothetical protein G6011_02535 [Alternaria panax]|uniref:Uncharacterized protein n=1 Tax=Alternaria panax TaxID=48097 RepID=A0AAD4F8W9_9PLEO|nr:hypothetical protein G6011_02535 [Alternaria panax]